MNRRDYALGVASVGADGGSSPKFSGAQPRQRRGFFVHARIAPFLWAAVRGGSKDSPVPEPGLLTPASVCPPSFSSEVRQIINLLRSLAVPNPLHRYVG